MAEERRKRLAIVAGSLIATGLLLFLVLRLGAWGFETKRRNLHHGRLVRMLEQRPLAEQVTEGLRAEGTRLLAVTHGARELQRVVAEHVTEGAEAVVREGGRWPETRVFLAADMLYFIHFDADGVMRGFHLRERPRRGSALATPY